MAIVKNVYGSLVLITGTVQEVAEQIAADQVPDVKFAVFYNGTNISAIYKMK